MFFRFSAWLACGLAGGEDAYSITAVLAGDIWYLCDALIPCLDLLLGEGYQSFMCSQSLGQLCLSSLAGLGVLGGVLSPLFSGGLTCHAVCSPELLSAGVKWTYWREGAQRACVGGTYARSCGSRLNVPLLQCQRLNLLILNNISGELSLGRHNVG